MQREHQDMFRHPRRGRLAEKQQTGPYQWALRQIEGLIGFGLQVTLHCRCLLGRPDTAQVRDRNGPVPYRADTLSGHAFGHFESGTQYFVTANDFIQGTLQHHHIQFAMQADRSGHVVERTVRIKLPQKP